MNNPKKTYSSFAEALGRPGPDTPVRLLPTPPAPKQWVDWPTHDISAAIVAGAAATLLEWLEARMHELRRERVDVDDIVIAHHGARTIISVEGKPRFEFKMKCTMGTR